MTVDQAEGPLAGLLVADFSRILAGPYATMLLADMGAEVVRVEGPGGDDTRTWQPPPAVSAETSSPSGDAITTGARWLALAFGLALLGLPLFWVASTTVVDGS